ncbi:MAG TPA: phosphoribosylformylglycinamidine synthase subunit PurL [Pyrinomonadaceae bacterium]|jgi:phosphoribosylformylglycinamidine synthase|nr:phosphoribosylformylglycinamidine synthase subunit PurL [Pyrinomonadaceae bacterium]
MNPETITPEVVSAHNLTIEEFARIKELLGREPTFTELGVFSVMWSEHCSYKSSRIHLKRLPTTGERVIVPPGENAGVVDLGDGWCAAFKVESHNHPSFIEPFQGAATGVGGILRDIFTMGARPLAAMNSLRFGFLEDEKYGRRNRALLAGVVAGIAHYGNAFGVPTIGGEVAFDDAYALNPLVNAFALGLVRRDQIFFGKATGVGNPILYVGAKTGRDGIHGATMASAEFDEEALEKRPTVQVGDPFLEKLLLEACLEAMRSGAVAGIQDMGAAGLTSSSCEMAARAGTGIELDLSLVPQREQGMTAYEMLLSESQERMLIVAHKGREREVMDIFRKWDLDAVVIGRVNEGASMRVVHNGETVADIPVHALTDEAPRYERPMKARDEGGSLKDEWAEIEASLKIDTSQDEAIMDAASQIQPISVHAANTDPTLTGEPGASVGGGPDIVQPAPSMDKSLTSLSSLTSQTNNQDSLDSRLQNEVLKRLVSAPNIASKEWVYRQYDHMVRTNTAVLPGADAAVVRIKETRRALAMCLDGNGRYCAANPREGAKLIVAEAARNVVCVGARPIAITNCLNFASPERPEVMWSFSEVIDGMSEACRALNTPVVSGNVSFYNETEGRGILPTPVIGMVGLIEDVRRTIQHGFKTHGDFIALLGVTNDDLSISEYAATIEGRTTDEMIREGRVPVIDMERERSVQEACLRAAEAGLLRSAHDCSDGGFAVALAECCFSSLNREAIGADVELTGTLPTPTRLFSESPSRIIISFDESALGEMEEITARASCQFTLLGRTGGNGLSIKADGEEVVNLPIRELEAAWRTALATKLSAQVMIAVTE